ncbi:MAG: transcriptional regulator [Gemmatimonas sp.]|nr:transcriptional regulator [Gemmatimonas sp.]
MVRRRGLVRPRDLERAGLPTAVLYRLRDQGEVEQVGPGLFRHPDAAITEKHTYAETAKTVPGGVVCLLSALSFHEIGTQMPHEVWLALRAHSKRPTTTAVPLRIVWFTGDAFTEGVETHTVERMPVKVYSPAKTIADLFKFRNKVGVDVAVEALRDAWSRRLVTMDEMLRFAKICRVEKVMRPYLEAIIS